MNDQRKFSISGPGSELARQYPEVERLLSSAGKRKSEICYHALVIVMRYYGLFPRDRKETETLWELLELAEANRLPYGGLNQKATCESLKNKIPEFEDPSFEPQFV